MLSTLTRSLFAGSPLLVFPLIALALFVLVFVAAAIRALRAERAMVEHLAALPLDEARHD